MRRVALVFGPIQVVVVLDVRASHKAVKKSHAAAIPADSKIKWMRRRSATKSQARVNMRRLRHSRLNRNNGLPFTFHQLNQEGLKELHLFVNTGFQ